MRGKEEETKEMGRGKERGEGGGKGNGKGTGTKEGKWETGEKGIGKVVKTCSVLVGSKRVPSQLV